MSLSNDQKAQILDLMADDHEPALAALLRECAGMMREKPLPDWWQLFTHSTGDYDLSAQKIGKEWRWDVYHRKDRWVHGSGLASTLPAAQAAAVAWVDANADK